MKYIPSQNNQDITVIFYKRVPFSHSQSSGT